MLRLLRRLKKFPNRWFNYALLLQLFPRFLFRGRPINIIVARKRNAAPFWVFVFWCNNLIYHCIFSGSGKMFHYSFSCCFHMLLKYHSLYTELPHLLPNIYIIYIQHLQSVVCFHRLITPGLCRLKHMVARLLLLEVMSRKRLMWKPWWKLLVLNCCTLLLFYNSSTSHHFPFSCNLFLLQVVDKWGTIDVVVNNAGICKPWFCIDCFT